MKSWMDVLKEAKIIGFDKTIADNAIEKKNYINNGGILYQDPVTKATVISTAHIDERLNRPWWNNYKDESFQKYLRRGMNGITNNKFFVPKEERIRFAVTNQDRTRALILSTRQNETNPKLYNSFVIVTILNVDSFTGNLQQVGLGIKERERIFTVTESVSNKIILECAGEKYEVDHIFTLT